MVSFHICHIFGWPYICHLYMHIICPIFSETLYFSFIYTYICHFYMHTIYHSYIRIICLKFCWTLYFPFIYTSLHIICHIFGWALNKRKLSWAKQPPVEHSSISNREFVNSQTKQGCLAMWVNSIMGVKLVRLSNKLWNRKTQQILFLQSYENVVKHFANFVNKTMRNIWWLTFKTFICVLCKHYCHWKRRRG